MLSSPPPGLPHEVRSTPSPNLSHDKRISSGGMPFPDSPLSSKLQRILLATLQSVERSPDLTRQEAEWVRHFAIETIAELVVLETTDEDEDDSLAA